MEVAPLSTLTNLMELDLHENKIVDVAPLSALANLKDLDLDGNQIVDVAPLSTLTNLTVLDLDGNQIVNVAPLSTLTNLMELDLHGNQIADFSALDGLIGNLVEYDASDQTDPLVVAADVNRDGIVNVTDLSLVAMHYRNSDFNELASSNIYPDVNGDAIVDVEDLVVVAAKIDAAEVAFAPPPTERPAGDISSHC